ncbi:ribbon-helix-helix protein, CopG family [Candidatus Berkelbacteria bacterium]|nr:ribbon-helix-helix protein, CopG family [Candidatus Berkelbacteria bacterium]
MSTKIINISLPKPILEKIDQAARRESRSRSEFIREVFRRQFTLEENWETLRAKAVQRAQTAGIRTERDVDRFVAQTRRLA